jgi:hypothetical protein
MIPADWGVLRVRTGELFLAVQFRTYTDIGLLCWHLRKIKWCLMIGYRQHSRHSQEPVEKLSFVPPERWTSLLPNNDIASHLAIRGLEILSTSTDVCSRKRVTHPCSFASPGEKDKGGVSSAGGAMPCSASARFLPALSVTTHDCCTTYHKI